MDDFKAACPAPHPRCARSRALLRLCLLLLPAVLPQGLPALSTPAVAADAAPSSANPVPVPATHCGPARPTRPQAQCSNAHDPGTMSGAISGVHTTDYRHIESPLTLSRHRTNLAPGSPGWQHSYAIRLWRTGPNALRLQLADQSTVRFTGSADQPHRFIPSERADAGVILREANGFHWRPADGRDLHFQGSLPVSIIYPDGARLALRYRQGVLRTVTDQHGHAIAFEYDAAQSGDWPPQPSHATVPDGTRLRLPSDLASASIAAATARRVEPTHRQVVTTPGNALLDAVRHRLGPAHSLDVDASIDGALRDLLLDGISVSERLAEALARRIEAGDPLDCHIDTTDGPAADDGGIDDSTRIANLMMRLLEAGPVCLGDAEHYAYWAQAVETQARQRPGGVSGPGTRKRTDFSCLPDYKTCDELKENLRRAELAACIYSGGSCPPDWKPVDPATLNIDSKHFQSRYFQTGLFHHPGDDLYVLAFRGTDEGFDWFDNGFNAMGIPANQYARATKLAGKVADALQSHDPGATLEFTGHSLGGGLATVAALNTGLHATVFNPASLHANQARWLGVSLDDAGYLVDVLTLGGDIVTRLQRIASAIRFVLRIPEQYGVAGDAPGRHSKLPSPDAAWISLYRQQRGQDISKTEILHSMAAIRASMQRLIRTHCRGTP